MGLRDAIDASRAGWWLTLCPDAGEGGGCFVASRIDRRVGVRGQAADPDRSKREAARRATRNVRRYTVANRLNRFLTLTYEGKGCFDPLEARAHVAEFIIRLRELLGGRALAYVWVPEWHKTHGLHLHLAFARFVPRSALIAAWGRGHVWIQLHGDLGVGGGSLAEARRTAAYLSKYISKAFDTDDRILGRHRYEVAQGFQPSTERIYGTSFASMAEASCDRMGSRPVREWRSDQEDEWRGPPSFWFQWA
jgi:hypothetical protein